MAIKHFGDSMTGGGEGGVMGGMYGGTMLGTGGTGGLGGGPISGKSFLASSSEINVLEPSAL